MNRRRSLTIVVALICLVALRLDVHAYKPNTRVWPDSNTTFKLTDSFVNQNSGWDDSAYDAAGEWNGETIFALNSNASSGNLVEHGAIDPPYQNAWAVTYWYWSGGYRTSYRIRVNNAMHPWYDGTQAPAIPAGYKDLQSVMVHEFGHAIGLGHVPARPQVMYCCYSPTNEIRDQVTTDEQNGVKFLYDANFISPHPVAQEPWGPVGNGTYDDTSKFIGYKGKTWQFYSGAPLSRNSTLAWNNWTGATSWLNFNSDSITWEYTKHYLRGTANVYIDNDLKGSFNLNDMNNTLWRVRRTWEVPAGNHILEVRNTDGTRYTDTDSFIVGISSNPAGIYDNLGSSVDYLGTWTHNSTCCPNAHNGTLSWSNVKDDAIVITFKGSAIDYYFTKAYNRGYVKVTIDGEFRENLDLYSSNSQWQQYKRYNVGSGIHTIHLAVAGNKHVASFDYYIDLDKFVVIN
jgi:Matrixin